jgi:hypothetical protein
VWSFLIFDFYRETNVVFLGFLHGVRGEFTDDVSQHAVGFIFTGTRSGFRNVVANLPRTPRKTPQNKKKTINLKRPAWHTQ